MYVRARERLTRKNLYAKNCAHVQVFSQKHAVYSFSYQKQCGRKDFLAKALVKIFMSKMVPQKRFAHPVEIKRFAKVQVPAPADHFRLGGNVFGPRRSSKSCATLMPNASAARDVVDMVGFRRPASRPLM